MSLDWNLALIVAATVVAVCAASWVVFRLLLKADEAEAAFDAWSN